ncbi:MAG: YncE family protein [Rhodoferax sp.]|nr:YncE family protein [Rhodoferax sp.]
MVRWSRGRRSLSGSLLLWGWLAGAGCFAQSASQGSVSAAAPSASTSAPVPASASATPAPIFVMNSLSASVSVIDPQTWREVQRIPTGKEPHHLYLTPDEKSLVVANALGDSLTFVDPRTAQVQRTVRGILDPYQLRFSPDMRWLVIAGNRLNHVDIYRWDGTEPRLVRRLASSRTPSHVWIDSRSSTVYATMQDSDELVAIDLLTQTEKWRVPTGPMPADVYGTPDDRLLLIGLTGGEGVEVFDVSTGQARRTRLIPTGQGAHAFRGAGDRRHVYVSNRVANSISKIDLQTLAVVDNYPAPSGPDCMDVSRDGRYLYVASRWAGKLSVIDTQTRTLVRQVPVGRSPHGVWTLDHAPRP